MKNLVLILSLLIAGSAMASEKTSWVLDKSHSQVKFAVTHMVIAEVTGHFRDFDVKMAASKDDFADATIEAKIMTASVDTDNEKRDTHLRSNDFFNAEKFPEMKFTSKSVEKVSGNKYKITGDLTIRDVTKSVVLDTKLNGMVKDPWGNTRVGFKATTTIDRFEFGTIWSTALETGSLIVSKEVEVTLLLEFIKGK